MPPKEELNSKSEVKDSTENSATTSKDSKEKGENNANSVKEDDAKRQYNP